jgi:hypothetical protein
MGHSVEEQLQYIKHNKWLSYIPSFVIGISIGLYFFF